MVPAEKLSKALIQDTVLRESPLASQKRQFTRFLVRWALFLGLALWTVGAFAQSTVSNYRIDALKASYQAAVEEHQSLEVAMAQLNNPGRLVGVAPALHMTEPASILVVDPTPTLEIAHRTVRQASLPGSVWKGAVNLIVGSLEQALGTW